LKEARKQRYLLEIRKYEATLRKTKMQSWKQYCKVTTLSNPWNAVYKLASGKIKSCSSLSTLRKTDGSVTTHTADTMCYMIDSSTPEDDETDNERHKLITAQTKKPIRTEDDKLFTLAEVRDDIKGLNKNKTPGENSVTSDIPIALSTFCPSLPKLCTTGV
jgi:hypothetical protein